MLLQIGASRKICDHHKTVGAELAREGAVITCRNRTMYAVTADFKNEELLANACETLASARTIANDFANLIPASQRRTLQGTAQLIMLGELP